MKWLQFKDLFFEFIHSNINLGGAQKMMYLKTYLASDAAKLIHHMQIAEDNYQSCWEILSNRYDNKRVQVTATLDHLMQQPCCKPESAVSIKTLHDTTMECLFAILNLDINVD